MAVVFRQVGTVPLAKDILEMSVKTSASWNVHSLIPGMASGSSALFAFTDMRMYLTSFIVTKGVWSVLAGERAAPLSSPDVSKQAHNWLSSATKEALVFVRVSLLLL